MPILAGVISLSRKRVERQMQASFSASVRDALLLMVAFQRDIGLLFHFSATFASGKGGDKS